MCWQGRIVSLTILADELFHLPALLAATPAHAANRGADPAVPVQVEPGLAEPDACVAAQVAHLPVDRSARTVFPA